MNFGIGALINRLLLWLCCSVFEAIESVYRLFYVLATTRLFGEETIREVSNNIYILVSVVILFAFAVKLIEAIVNPDLLTDSKKGVTGVLKRTIIGLVLVAIVPSCFNLAYKISREVIATSLVEKIVLGYTEASSDSNNTAGVLTSSVIRGFVYPIDENGVAIDENSLCGDNEGCNFAEELANYNMSYQNYISIIGANPNYDEFGDINVESEWENGNNMYHMSLFFLLVVGVYIWYQVILLCFDAALRLVNLGILEIMAPLVIVAYMGGGTDYLSKWFKMVLEKFLSVFVRIAALAFMALGLRLMFDKDSILFNQSTTFLFRLLIIIGLLRLIKDLPNIIGKIFGVDIKDAGGIKGRLGEMAGIGKLAQNAWSGLGGLAKGIGATAGVAAAHGAKNLGKKFDTKVLGGKAGRFINNRKQSGLARYGRVLKAGVKSKGKGTGKAFEEAYGKEFSAEEYAMKQEYKKLEGKKNSSRFSKASKKANSNSFLHVDDNGGIKFTGNSTEAMQNRDTIAQIGARNTVGNVVNNLEGLSSTQREKINKYNTAKSDYSRDQVELERQQRRKSHQQELISRINQMKDSASNAATQERLDSIIRRIQNGDIDHMSQIEREFINGGMSFSDKSISSNLLSDMISSTQSEAARQQITAIKAKWDSGQIQDAQSLEAALRAIPGLSNEVVSAVVSAANTTSDDLGNQLFQSIQSMGNYIASDDDLERAILHAQNDLDNSKESLEKSSKAFDEMVDAMNDNDETKNMIKGVKKLTDEAHNEELRQTRMNEIGR